MQQHKGSIADLFGENLIFMDIDHQDYQSLLAGLGGIAYETGRVKQSFVNALLAREEKYPTGLHSEVLDFAIPHTDAEHVVCPGVIVARLANPMPFGEMGSLGGTVGARYVFLLLLVNNGSQVPLLQGIVEMCSDQKVVDLLNKSDTAAQMYRVITGYLREREQDETARALDSIVRGG